MKLLSDDPQFTAWLLGELPADEAAEIARQVAADPALTLAARQSQQYHQQLSEIFSQNEPALHPLQREKILMASRNKHLPAPNSLQPSPRTYTGWWISAAAAAAIILGILLQDSKPSNHGADAIAREISLLPVDGGSIPSNPAATTSVSQVGGGTNEIVMPPTTHSGRASDDFLQRIARDVASSPLPLASELPAQSLRHFVSSSTHPQAILPLQAGDSSWKWISRSIIEKNTLPVPQMIRVEEMVNAFPITPSAPLTATAAPSPYFPTRQWIFIHIHNATPQSQSAQLTYFAPMNTSYRLVGFSSSRSLNTGSTASIPAHTQTTLLLEVEHADAANLGKIHLVMGQSSENLPLISASPDTQHRHLACIAGFGMLLGGASLDRHSQPIDHAILMREISSLEAQVSSPTQRSSLAILKKGMAMIKTP